jgi:hypothetical protein
MAKTYTVDLGIRLLRNLRQIAVADWTPGPNDQPAVRGPRLMLEAAGGNGVHVVGAGHSAPINFAAQDFIDTAGLANCFAVCAVWNKVGNEFQNGFLAHVSSPHGQVFTNAIAPANIPVGAWIVVCVGTGGWGVTIANRLAQAGHAADHAWIYTRQMNAVGFGIDKRGRFGEI